MDYWVNWLINAPYIQAHISNSDSIHTNFHAQINCARTKKKSHSWHNVKIVSWLWPLLLLYWKRQQREIHWCFFSILRFATSNRFLFLCFFSLNLHVHLILSSAWIHSRFDSIQSFHQLHSPLISCASIIKASHIKIEIDCQQNTTISHPFKYECLPQVWKVQNHNTDENRRYDTQRRKILGSEDHFFCCSQFILWADFSK